MDLMADFRLLHGPMLVEAEEVQDKMAMMLPVQVLLVEEEMEGVITTKQVPV